MRLYMPAAALATLRKGKSTRVTLTAKRCDDTDVKIDAADPGELQPDVLDHEQVLLDYKVLVRELDALLNGKTRTPRGLGDIVAQVRKVVGPGPALFDRVPPL